MASGIVFEEIEAKSIINKTVMPGGRSGYTINPYRGCQHACIYCFARGTHEYLGSEKFWFADFFTRYGDLPWTARAEMLTEQWILSRPEMRFFLHARDRQDRCDSIHSLRRHLHRNS